LELIAKNEETRKAFKFSPLVIKEYESKIIPIDIVMSKAKDK
jgi:hypothetical protein